MFASRALYSGAARHAGHHEVERAERDQRVPAERARMHVADGPFGEVAESR